MNKTNPEQTAWAAAFLFAASICLFHDPLKPCLAQMMDLWKAAAKKEKKKKLNISKLHPGWKKGPWQQSATLI